MPDGTTSLIMDALKYAWALLLGLVVWNGKRVINRVDKLETNHVDKDTFNKTLGALRQDIGDHAKEMKAEIRGVTSRIDKLVDK